MENKVIEVLEYLGEKLGIAIDWTSENVMPQVMELLDRYRTYSVWKNSVGLVVSLIVATACVYAFKKAFSAQGPCRKTKIDNFWWEAYGGGVYLTNCGVVTLIIAGAAAFLGMIFIGVNTTSLLKWALVPELKYIEMLNTMIGA